MKNELIIVTPTNIINKIYYNRISPIIEKDIKFILENSISYQREIAEQDERYKQLIAYLILKYQDEIFLVQRKSNCSEQRLAKKYSIGIGGHLQKKDVEKPFSDWGIREFHEEVLYEGALKISNFLIINDNSNSVGKTHLGIVYTIELASKDILLKNELHSCQFCSFQDIQKYDSLLEPWSQYILPYLKENTVH